MTNETVAARPAALLAPAPRKARRPRFASVTALLRAMTSASASMDPIDRMAAQWSADAAAEAVRMSLLSRSIDGDVWATATLAALYASR